MAPIVRNGGKRRRSRVRLVAASVALTVGAVAFAGVNLALPWDDSPVSHWRSADAQRRFERVYAETMTLLPEPTETVDVSTDFGTVRAYRFVKAGADREFADRDPLVLLPGHSAPTPMWRSNLEGLMAGRPVIAIDLLGQPGLSVPTRTVEDAADQARWLDQTLAGLGEDRVHLLGVSFGGWTAMNYVRYHPGRVASVSLLDPVLVFAPLSWRVVVASIPTAMPLVPRAYSEWFASWTANGAPVDETPEARIITSGLDDYAVVEPAPEQIPDDALRAVRTPVLAIMAERSVMHDPEAAAEKARATVPGVDVSVKAGASHAINGEFAGEMNARVLDFAARH